MTQFSPQVPRGLAGEDKSPAPAVTRDAQHRSPQNLGGPGYTRSAALFASHEERGAQDCCQVLTFCVSRAADTLSQVMTVRHFCNLYDTLVLFISRLGKKHIREGWRCGVENEQDCRSARVRETGSLKWGEINTIVPVSYTHLTLPTKVNV